MLKKGLLKIISILHKLAITFQFELPKNQITSLFRTQFQEIYKFI